MLIQLWNSMSEKEKDDFMKAYGYVRMGYSLVDGIVEFWRN